MAKFLPACSGDDSAPRGITTYVYMMMENRSYDHVFGARKLLEGLPGDGLTAGMKNPDLQRHRRRDLRPGRRHDVRDRPAARLGQRSTRTSTAGRWLASCAHQTRPQRRASIDPMQYLTRDSACR